MPPQNGQTTAMAWEAYVGTTPYDNINNDYWAYNQLSSGKAFKSINGGRTINGPIEYALNTTVSSYDDMDPIATNRVDVFDEFTYQWKQYSGTFVMSEKEKAFNQGEGRKFDLRPAKLENLHNSFRSTINTDLYLVGTVNSSKTIGGLAYIVSSTPSSGTMGGIDRGTYTFWRNQQQAGTQSASDYDNLRASMRTLYNNCSAGVNSKHPEWWVFTQTDFEGYESLLTQNERVTGKGKEDANLGFVNSYLMFKDTKVNYDRACPTATAYCLNNTDLKLGYQKGYWMKAFPAVDPANQTIEVVKIMTICNLFSPNPRRLGVLTSIS